MADDIDYWRNEVIQLALEQESCHYVWGGTGNTPDLADGAWYRKSAVKMYPNHPETPRPGHGEHGRRQPILFAAWCRVDGDKVCAGMCDQDWVAALPQGDPDNPHHVAARANYKWQRPSGVITADSTVWGECCEGTRHFDCIGLVNYCLSVALENYTIWYGIPSLRGLPEVRAADVLPADILTHGNEHIGLADGDGGVIHASGTRRGVLHDTAINWGYWRCGRLPWKELLRGR